MGLKMGNNVLFIFADQMHRYTFQCMGTPDIQTPHLDQLANDRVFFRNAYSSCPVSTPFRINFLTGYIVIKPEVIITTQKFLQKEQL